MKIFLTEIQAVCIEDGITRTYAGPKIQAIDWNDAEEICRVHFPFCKVYGMASLEVSMGEDGWDWGNATDYEKQELN